MVLSFLQQRGLLDGNTAYLRTHLVCYRQHGMLRCYADFLHLLCCEGLGQPATRRSAAAIQILGDVPYAGAGLFRRHHVEEVCGSGEPIPDAAFARVLDCFDQYSWVLDVTDPQPENVVTPDILGGGGEEHTNRRQTGSYYTQADITAYIGQNTIIPLLFDTLCQGDNEAVWNALVRRAVHDKPDRYIHAAVRWGVSLPLPPEIAAGFADASRRVGWNAAAPPVYALPTETWREVIARRAHYTALKRRLVAGVGADGHSALAINDCITCNLDLPRLIRDVIASCDNPELLHACFRALEAVRILDPTCGTGAFLVAALDILEPLYAACLERMQVCLRAEGGAGATAEPVPHEALSACRAILEDVARAPSRRYAIRKAILAHNLYGVDMAEEAVAICKYRLWLKLVALTHCPAAIEACPAIDAHIRTGNALVGYVGEPEACRVQPRHADEDACWEAALDQRLAREYGIDDAADGSSGYRQWRVAHQPFHWCSAFREILRRGGFDVIIGNPPYLEYAPPHIGYSVRGYQTEGCGNLYAFVIERGLCLLRDGGRMGMIVPHSAICTDRMAAVQALFAAHAGALWVSTYAIRPATLFPGIDQRLAVYLLQQGRHNSTAWYTARYHRWHDALRPHLLALVRYIAVPEVPFPHSIPKIQTAIEGHILARLRPFAPLRAHLVPRPPACTVYFHNAPRYWIRAMTFAPYFWNERDGAHLSTQVKTLRLATRLDASVVVAVLNSSLFYWWFIVLSDCRHLNLREIAGFPLGLERMATSSKQRLAALCEELMIDLQRHARRKMCVYRATGRVVYDEFAPKHSKPLIDEIDRTLARHYGFTAAETDMIIDFDIRYRMGW